MHICVGKLTTIGSDNGLSPGRRQAIIQTNAGMLLIGHPERNNINITILVDIHTNLDCFIAFMHSPNGRQVACLLGCARELSVVFEKL